MSTILATLMTIACVGALIAAVLWQLSRNHLRYAGGHRGRIPDQAHGHGFDGHGSDGHCCDERRVMADLRAVVGRPAPPTISPDRAILVLGQRDTPDKIARSGDFGCEDCAALQSP